MRSISELYALSNKNTISSSGVNLIPPRKYLDPLKIKEQKQKVSKNYVTEKPKGKINLKAKKGTFLQQIEEREKNLPSPQSYEPKQFSPSYKSRKYTGLPERKTIFEELYKREKKSPSPSPLNYSPVKLKSKSTGSFNKAPNFTYLDATISRGSRLPGIGEYNANRQKYDKTLGKWDTSKRSLDASSSKKEKIPSSAAYSPHKVDKGLFSEMTKLPKKSSMLGKEKRFMQKQNVNKNLHYTGISQWGMKSHYKKNDLLNNLSTHNSYSKSVYYQ